MARLPRRHIPLEVRCRVALRQLGEMWPDLLLEETPAHGRLLTALLARLAPLLGCEVAELRLDHDPALGARGKIRKKGVIVRYVPDEHDPEHLRYRPHGPQHAGSHLIKTNVRGDHGQFPDRVLIKRERRRERPKSKGRPKMARRGKALQGRSQWPPKGSRKIRGRT